MNDKLIMVVDDDDSLREAIVITLVDYGYKVVDYKSGIDALSKLMEVKPSLVISDVNMSPIDGMGLMASIHKKDDTLPVILITAYGSVERAVDAIKLGARDYMLKPFEPEVLISMVIKHIRSSKNFNDDNEMIAIDESMVALSSLAKRVAKSDATVMITGHSGTGKEILSKFIHYHSSRKDMPFIAINCAAIPENMLESTLFGYEKGAYTGAYQACPGKFELAQGGTILLDEISEMDISLQAKILRVLQEREVERLGGKKTISLNVRVIATSNRDLRKEVEEGRFREDLYYRLNVFPLRVPSLNERKKDIAELARKLISKWSRLNNSSVNSITDEAIYILETYPWPGNVRELDNVIQRAIIMTDTNEIDVNDIRLDSYGLGSCVDTDIGSLKTERVDIKDNEYQLISTVLESVGWKRKEASLKLGISERTLRYKMSKMKKSGYSIQSG